MADALAAALQKRKEKVSKSGKFLNQTILIYIYGTNLNYNR